jgi:hypothetical protein
MVGDLALPSPAHDLTGGLDHVSEPTSPADRLAG